MNLKFLKTFYDSEQLILFKIKYFHLLIILFKIP
jgi:hypothetical protein